MHLRASPWSERIATRDAPSRSTCKREKITKIIIVGAATERGTKSPAPMHPKIRVHPSNGRALGKARAKGPQTHRTRGITQEKGDHPAGQGHTLSQDATDPGGHPMKELLPGGSEPHIRITPGPRRIGPGGHPTKEWPPGGSEP